MTSPRRRRAESTSVFVYGTLLAGEANHGTLADARPLGPATTAPGFELRDLGAYPALVAVTAAGGGASAEGAAAGAERRADAPASPVAVLGELYAVDRPTLAALDRLEGHPRFYRRTTIALANGGTAEAYLLSPAQAAGYPVIASGDWRRRG